MDNITALDTEIMSLVQPTETETPAVEVVATHVTETPVETVPVTETTTPLNEIEIEGIGKVTFDDIKEWQKGHMRQQDYTRKTQEVAKQRDEVKDALEVFNYLKTKPQLVEKLKTMDTDGIVDTNIMDRTSPQNDILRELWIGQETMKLDKEIDRLKGIYGDVDEVALFNKAAELNVNSDNMEVLYKAMAYDSKPQQTIDENAIVARAKAELLAELQQSRTTTGTIVTAPSAPTITTPVVLTPEEQRVARGMRMTDAEYAKWKK